MFTIRVKVKIQQKARPELQNYFPSIIYLKKICPSAEILNGLAIHGTSAKNSENQVATWAKKSI
ncbi:MAG: hypothetical protein IJS81_08945 [Selenomonadaceae bacterium]|nr:hypothetical protein [Selenomonadaceae bacterium]